MNTLMKQLEWIAEWTGRAVAWMTLLMVLLTFLIVVLRYVFNLGWIGMQESVTYLHAIVFMLGAAYTLKHEEHVRVDIFYRDMSPQRRARVDLLGTLFLLTPVCLFIFFASWDYVLNSWSLREGSADPGGLPIVYLLKATLLVMPLLVLIQGLAQALRAWAVLKNKEFTHG